MEDKKTTPSLPSNYVTLAQLQERWLREKERKRLEEEQQQQQQQQKEDQKCVADRVKPDSESPSQTLLRPRRRGKREGSVPTAKEVEVAGGDGADQEGKGEGKTATTTTTTKKKKNKKKRKGNKRGVSAEKEAAEGGAVAEAPLASVEKEGVSASGNQEGGGEARAERDSLDQASNVEPKSRVSSLNGGIGKGDDRLRRNRDKRNRERRGPRGKTRAESSDLGQKADAEPEVRVLSVNCGIVEVSDELGEHGTRGETRAKSKSLDQTADIEPKFKALSVNGLIGKGNNRVKRNGEKSNGGKSIGTGDETREGRNNLDQRAHIEPNHRATSVNGRIGKGNNGLRRRGAHHNHGHREIGRFGCRREVWNANYSRMVWVKKGDQVSDGNG